MESKCCIKVRRVEVPISCIYQNRFVRTGLNLTSSWVSCDHIFRVRKTSCSTLENLSLRILPLAFVQFLMFFKLFLRSANSLLENKLCYLDKMSWVNYVTAKIHLYLTRNWSLKKTPSILRKAGYGSLSSHNVINRVELTGFKSCFVFGMRVGCFTTMQCMLHCVWYVIFRSCVIGQVIEVSPSNQTVKEGRDANINCTYSASNGTDINGIKYTWRGLNGTGVLSNTSQLTLKNINRTDAGNYSCIVTNVSANWNSTTQALVLVSCKYAIVYASFKDFSSLNDYGSSVGHCRPKPEILWSILDYQQKKWPSSKPMSWMWSQQLWFYNSSWIDNQQCCFALTRCLELIKM